VAVQRYNENRNRADSGQVTSNVDGAAPEAAAAAGAGAKDATGTKAPGDARDAAAATAGASGAAVAHPGAAVSPTAGASAPTTTPTSGEAPSSDTHTGPAAKPPAAPPAPTPAPVSRLAASLEADDLSAIGEGTVHVSGAMRMRVGDDTAVGSLRGTLAFGGGATAEEAPSTAKSAETTTTTAGDASTTSSTTPESTSTSAAKQEGETTKSGGGTGGDPTTVTGELFLSVEDAQTFKVVLDGALERLADGSSRVTGTYRLFDQCGAELVARTLGGSLRIEQAPVASAIRLDLADFAADATTLRRPASCS
jgi:hypothetical protein